MPIDKGSMETRIDHSIQWAKRKMRLEFADDDDGKEDDDEDSDSNDDYGHWYHEYGSVNKVSYTTDLFLQLYMILLFVI